MVPDEVNQTIDQVIEWRMEQETEPGPLQMPYDPLIGHRPTRTMTFATARFTRSPLGQHIGVVSNTSRSHC